MGRMPELADPPIHCRGVATLRSWPKASFLKDSYPHEGLLRAILLSAAEPLA